MSIEKSRSGEKTNVVPKAAESRTVPLSPARTPEQSRQQEANNARTEQEQKDADRLLDTALGELEKRENKTNPDIRKDMQQAKKAANWEDGFQSFGEAIGKIFERLSLMLGEVFEKFSKDKNTPKNWFDRPSFTREERYSRAKENLKNRYTGVRLEFLGKHITAQEFINAAQKVGYRNGRPQPYKWGGDGADGRGIDCSGLMIAALQETGAVKGDATARDLYSTSQKKDITAGEVGDCIFWKGGSSGIKHVAIITKVLPGSPPRYETIESSSRLNGVGSDIITVNPRKYAIGRLPCVRA